MLMKHADEDDARALSYPGDAQWMKWMNNYLDTGARDT